MVRRQKKRRAGEVELRSIQANAGITAGYRRKIMALVDAMADSVEYWLTAAYRATPPTGASDDAPPVISAREIPTAAGNIRWAAFIDGEVLVSTKTGRTRAFNTEAAALRAARIELGTYLPADELQAVMTDLAEQWQGEFDDAADAMARYFSRSVSRRSDAALMASLKKAGIAVAFLPSPAMRDIMAATVQANVQLIRSIPQQYLGNVQGEVMRSVQAGRDLAPLARYLQRQYGVTKRRAALIALDQNNKATSAMQKARQVEIGVVEALWMHSHAGREPRPTHVANDGKRYNVAEGWFDPDPRVRRRIWPGELIKCRCFSKAIITTAFKAEAV